MPRFPSRLLLALPLLVAAACADSEPATLDTGLPRDKPADEVSPAEAQAACARYEELANQALGADVQLDLTCTITGVVTELTGGGACGPARSQCLANPTSTPTPVDFDCENAITFAPSGCDATIGELEDCVTSVARSIDSVTSRIDCSLVDHLDRLGELGTDLAAITGPSMNEACAGLSEECLALLGWTEEATPTLPTGP